MSAARKAVSHKGTTKVVSIQAKRKRGYKSRASQMQAETLRAAWNHGNPWTDDDVSLIAQGLNQGMTTVEIAYSIGRTYYSTSTTRAHVSFALRHMAVLQAAWKRAGK